MDGAEAWSSNGSDSRERIGLLLVHGFTGNPTSMRPLGEALAARGFRVEVIRLPGHGTSWRDMYRTRYADWRAEVVRALDALKERCAMVVMVGLSMGGTLVLDVAASRSKDVKGVVPINASVLAREGAVAKLAPLLEKILPVVPAKAAGLTENDIAKPGQNENAYAWVPAAAGNSFLRELPRIRTAIEGMRVPALVAYSPQDHSVPPENSKAVLEMLAGRDVTELVLDRSYHVATLDYDADLLVERITQFADRLNKPA
jgi:carboxylesterase